MSDSGLNIEQEGGPEVAPSTEVSPDVTESSNTNFERTDDIYREAAGTEVPTPEEEPHSEIEVAPEEEAPVAISASDITLDEQVTPNDEAELQEESAPDVTVTPSPETPEEAPSLLEQGLSTFSSWCNSAAEYYNSYAEEHQDSFWGGAASWLSWGLSGVSSFVSTVSSIFSEEPVERSSAILQDRQEKSIDRKNLSNILETPEQLVKTLADDIGPETGDILILKNDRIRKLKELMDRLHQALEDYRAHHEEREEQEEKDEIEEYHEYRDELTEIVTEIQKVMPSDAPEVRQLLESYEHKVLHEDLPPDVLYQQAMDIVEDLQEREEATTQV